VTLKTGTVNFDFGGVRVESLPVPHQNLQIMESSNFQSHITYATERLKRICCAKAIEQC
jgi:hypothetical protein